MEEEASLQSRRFNDEGARACSNAEMEGSSPPEVTGGYSEATAGAGGYPSSFGGGGGARYKLMSPAKLPIARSLCTLTIPPGLSPTSFLESPVLLSNIKAEPSPTTGTFSLPLLMQGTGETSGFPWMGNRNSINTVNDPNSSNFEFQFHPGPSAASAQKLTGISVSSSFNQHRQVLDSLRSSCIKPVVLVGKESSFSAPAPSQAEPNGSSQKSHPTTNNRPSSSDHKDSTPSAVSDRSSEDGYNWRKYGQKLVKGSEFPRSYYKCTYPNCEVKKIFERAPDGQITEIVYKGSHDHPKPQPSRRFTPGTLVSIQEERFDKELASTGQEDKLSINSQPGSAEPNSTPVPSPQQENEDVADGTPQLQCVNEDGEEEDPYAKRRKLDGTLEITPVVKPIREPRVVVQTVSEVDILDDGYRWRKYGQKVVRGNPNPRSYYKCTHAGCPVRKHVERASHDPKAVITTYEGKHNHDVPTARTSSHEMAGPTNTTSGMSMARMRPEDNNDHHPISLDLGVGRSYGSDFRSENQAGQLQMLNSEHGYSHVSGTASTLMAVQACYNGNINMYGSRENMADGNGYENAALQAQNQHQQNIGRVLMGP